jgi:DMSO/TMAO reductase YedYZ molybdopterin-dependent catalytic subunit
MLTIDGEVARAISFDLKALRALPGQVADVAEHVPGREGSAVWLREVLSAAQPTTQARWATLATADGRFAICVALDALLDRALLVYRLGEAPLPDNKGGPVRLLLSGKVECHAPELDACAMVKGLARVRLTAERQPDVGHKH